MSGKYKYSNNEQKIINVLNYQDQQLKRIKRPSLDGGKECIAESEALLMNLGYGSALDDIKKKKVDSQIYSAMEIPSWESLCREAEKTVGAQCTLETIFTQEELKSNERFIQMLNKEYNMLHCLDEIDYAICATAAIVAGAIDILMVGIPAPSPTGIKAGTLSNYIRQVFDKKFPQSEMEKLANSKISKVPYDAQDNRHTTIRVEGLSAYYHRLLSLGHDPLLGFIVGVFDILTGRMTTIDKQGKFVTQVMEDYTERKECQLFVALAKQVIHFKSDITTSMSLPVPLMALFNFLQFGNIGEEEQTIAEIVQGMYFEGYDFIHFCSMSVSAMMVEVIVRLCYAIKSIKSGRSIKEAIPFSFDREKLPKLATMLFIGHSGATAINAGKVYFTGNPMAINYPQWIAFAKYSYKQLKWVLVEKEQARENYVKGKINEDLSEIYREVDNLLMKYTDKYLIV